MKKLALAFVLVTAMLLGACTSAPVSEVVNNEADTEDYPKYEKVDTESLALYKQVAQVLEGCENTALEKPLVEKDTVAYYPSEGKAMYELGKAEVALDRSIGFPFVQIVSDKSINHFAGFNALADNGLVKPDNEALEDDGVAFDFVNQDITIGTLDLNSPQFFQEKKSFAYSEQGCKELAERIVMLAKTAEGNRNCLTCEGYSPKMYFSESDDCYYSFVMQYNTSRAYVTAVYMTSEDGKTVTDVTIQYMFINYPVTDCEAGVSIGINRALLGSRFEMITLFTATEQALAGDCYFASRSDIPRNHYQASYVVPKEYKVGDYTANLTVDKYRTENDELFELYTYSLSLE